VLTAAFGNTHHYFSIATRMLTRYQPEPCCQVAAVLEVGAVTDYRYHCGCSLRPASSDLRYPLTNIAGFEDRSNLAIESFDAFIDLDYRVSPKRLYI
jgi:hypothetical protein